MTLRDLIEYALEYGFSADATVLGYGNTVALVETVLPPLPPMFIRYKANSLELSKDDLVSFFYLNPGEGGNERVGYFDHYSDAKSSMLVWDLSVNGGGYRWFRLDKVYNLELLVESRT